MAKISANVSTEKTAKVDLGKLTPVGDGMVHIRYEEVNAKHVVYLEVSNKVRRVIFPTQSQALNFMHGMKGYDKLRSHL